MTRTPYDDLPWWRQLLWFWFGPPWYEQAEDLDVCLTVYWCALHLSTADLAEPEEGDDQSHEEFLAKAARLIAAHHQAEKTIRCRHAPLATDDEDDSDVDDAPVRPRHGRSSSGVTIRHGRK